MVVAVHPGIGIAVVVVHAIIVPASLRVPRLVAEPPARGGGVESRRLQDGRLAHLDDADGKHNGGDAGRQAHGGAHDQPHLGRAVVTATAVRLLTPTSSSSSIVVVWRESGALWWSGGGDGGGWGLGRPGCGRSRLWRGGLRLGCWRRGRRGLSLRNRCRLWRPGGRRGGC